MDKIEMLSRMWIECDPNRRPSNPDQIIGAGGRSEAPYWHWFRLRARESLKFFEKHGFELREKAGTDKPSRMSDNADDAMKVFTLDDYAYQAMRDIVALAGGTNGNLNFSGQVLLVLRALIEKATASREPAAPDRDRQVRGWESVNVRRRSGSSPASPQDLTACAMIGSTGDAECDRQERDAPLLWGGAPLGGEAAKNQPHSREVKRQRDLQLLAEAYQIANERGHVGLASSIAHLFGELHLDTAA